MVLIVVLAVAFTVWMAVEAFRREGGVSVWLLVILVLGPIGAVIYFFAEYAQHLFARPVFEIDEEYAAVTLALLAAAHDRGCDKRWQVVERLRCGRFGIRPHQ